VVVVACVVVVVAIVVVVDFGVVVVLGLVIPKMLRSKFGSKAARSNGVVEAVEAVVVGATVVEAVVVGATVVEAVVVGATVVEAVVVGAAVVEAVVVGAKVAGAVVVGLAVVTGATVVSGGDNANGLFSVGYSKKIDQNETAKQQSQLKDTTNLQILIHIGLFIRSTSFCSLSNAL
jgi:hypothetical protein